VAVGGVLAQVHKRAALGGRLPLAVAALVLLASAAVSFPAEAKPANKRKCTVVGTAKADKLRGTKKVDVICGRGGADLIQGRAGNDVLIGGPGSDSLNGGPGDDELLGGPGNDQLVGGPGVDALTDSSGFNFCMEIEGQVQCITFPFPPGQGPPTPPEPRDCEPGEWAPSTNCVDVLPPEVDYIEVSPDSQEVDGSEQEVVIWVQADDDNSELGSGTGQVRRPDGSTTAVPLQVWGGNALRGTVPLGTDPDRGVYELTSVAVEDDVGNEASLDDAALDAGGAAGPWATATLLWSGGDDTGVELVDFDLAETSVDTSAAPATIHLRVDAQDDLSGVKQVCIKVKYPNFPTPSGRCVPRSSGSAANGRWKWDLELPAGAPQGTYRVERITFFDYAGNSSAYDRTALEARESHLDFVQLGPGDTTPPQIAGLEIGLLPPDEQIWGNDIQIRAHITDDISGVGEGIAHSEGFEVDYEEPVPDGSTGGRYRRLISGTPADGVWAFDVNFEPGAQTGTYTVESITAWDRAGNRVTLTTADLQARGWPYTFENP
jgi:hypothetical protein